ncbi:DEAD/DEAH box helicase [Kitasatospora paracochleata]|uniref:DEAD/DEAH box helicase n=1 Tax=Kitasatospora paracochleata TaxID=58354 RepID=UPI0031DB901A
MEVVKPVPASTPVRGGVALRRHQEEALEAILGALSDRPEVDSSDGLRTTVVMGTGTGKSFVGAVAGQRLAPHGAVLVVVPTLDLLLQMVGAWRTAGRAGGMYAVCSLEPGELPHGVAGTTSGVQIANWLAAASRRRQPVTLFATYASVGAVADAYTVDPDYLGMALPPLALMVCDEAHRSSGSAEKSWAVVHDQEAIPARRRLYMTATPRVWAAPRFARRREGAWQPLVEDLVCSMDDVSLYGEVCFELGLQASIERGLLAPFEVVVLELRDPWTHGEAVRRQPVPYGPGVGEEEGGEDDLVQPERVAAVQAGLVRACVERGLRRVITFHNRTLEARYFTETLNQTVERLHQADPRTYPAEFWAQWLSGEHGVDFRKQVMRAFAGAEEKHNIPHAILGNCKVLSEGVDIPNADAVLLQGRGSMVDIVQAVGRALRLTPGEGKVASLIVPVFLRPGEEPEDFLESESYGPLVKILTALRSYDERLVEALAVPQHSPKRTKGRSAETVALPGQGDGAEGVPAFVLPVRFQEPKDADALALFIRMKVLTGENQYWREGITHARQWAREHGTLAKVPYSAVVGRFPLGRWLSDRRADHAAGVLATHRVDMLDELGMTWSVADARWQAGLDWARAWAKEHGGSIAAPARASIGAFAIGQWLATARAAAAVPEGEPGALSPERRRQLEEIDPFWCPTWPITWQRTYTAARMWWLASDGRVDWAQLPEDTMFEGEQLGRWVKAQRAGWPGLEPDQQDLLAAIGIEPDPELVTARAAAAAKPKVSRADRFAQGLAALAAFVEREGHARVPRAHKEPLEVAVAGPGGEESTEVVHVGLGAWLNNQKARRGKLTPGQLAQLAEHGVEWA